jgi:hypothetical protein
MPGEGHGPSFEQTRSHAYMVLHGGPLQFVQELESARVMPGIAGGPSGCAYRSKAQKIQATHGTVAVQLRDGLGQDRVIRLRNPAVIIYIPPMVWIRMQMPPRTTCVVAHAASGEDADRIDDYELFTAEVLEQLKSPNDMN